MNVKEMSIEELERRINDVVVQITRIKTQLESAKAEYERTGIRTDQQWYVSAKHALRVRGHNHQMLMVELAKRNKQVRCERNSTVERKFMEVARVRLSKEDFLRIAAEAEMLADLGKNKTGETGDGTVTIREHARPEAATSNSPG